MRSDLKIGIIVGVLLVVGLIAFFVSRGGETAEPQAPPTMADNQTEPVRDYTAEPVKEEAPPPVKEVTPPPVKEEVAKPVKEEIPPPVAEEKDDPQPRYYVVKEGDNLSRIAQSFYADEKFAVVIQMANKDRIKDIDMVQPGWRLWIPYPDEAAEIWKTIK